MPNLLISFSEVNMNWTPLVLKRSEVITKRAEKDCSLLLLWTLPPSPLVFWMWTISSSMLDRILSIFLLVLPSGWCWVLLTMVQQGAMRAVWRVGFVDRTCLGCWGQLQTHYGTINKQTIKSCLKVYKEFHHTSSSQILVQNHTG